MSMNFDTNYMLCVSENTCGESVWPSSLRYLF